MKRFVLAVALMSFGFMPSLVQAKEEPPVQSGQTDTVMPIQSIDVAKKKLAVRLYVEPLNEEQKKAGLTEEEIQGLVAQKLEDSGIHVDSAIAQPVLTLRIRTIQSGLDYATFFQLTLQEESMLVRNRSTFNAVTWSQASLLSCRTEELKKEVVDTVTAMTQSFSKDFVAALRN